MNWEGTGKFKKRISTSLTHIVLVLLQTCFTQ